LEKAGKFFETLMSIQGGDNPFAYWTAGVQIRSCYVKGVMSADATRAVLDRNRVAQAEIENLRPVLRALETENDRLSTIVKGLQADLNQIKSSEEKIQQTLEELTVPEI
jgi:uncharacterized protein YlxW (UPF0749 family)